MAVLKSRARRHFVDEGWLLLSSLVPATVCKQVKQAFVDEVRDHPGPLRRQLTSREEPHRLSTDGHVQNPIVNPHQTEFARFSLLEQTIMRSSPIVDVVSRLLGAPVAMLQSAYYESSAGTLTHQDFSPFDQDAPMIGAWVALEDIGPRAGRFFVYPRSHDLKQDEGLEAYRRLAWSSYQAAFVELVPDVHEAAAQNLLNGVVHRAELEKTAPALKRGDVLFWDNRLLHGSLVPEAGGGSRHSVLFHFVELEAARQDGRALKG